MDIKSYVEEAIALSELFLGLPKGGISWGMKTKRIDGDTFACVYFKFKGHEFINVMAVAISKTGGDIGDALIKAQDSALSKVPSVISVYGIVNMIESLGAKSLKLVYISDPEFKPLGSIAHKSWVSDN